MAGYPATISGFRLDTIHEKDGYPASLVCVFFYCNVLHRDIEAATAEHLEIQKKWDIDRRQLQETHNEARKVGFFQARDKH